MKRLTISSIALLCLLAVAPPSALAGGAGHNPPTRMLERAFTIALTARIGSADGCYPSPPALAELIREQGGMATKVGKGASSAKSRNVVYVLRSGSSCNGVRFGLRFKKALYVLDSTRGEVRVVGRRSKTADPAVIANRGPLRGVKLIQQSFTNATPNRRVRYLDGCPARTFPLGGGMYATPGVGADGEGVYPHSFERLGAQGGWHVTAWLADPSGGPAASRQVNVQVVCARGLAPTSAPHSTTFLRPGASGTVVARCRGGGKLMSGGFQRTNFLGNSGNYVTESRAVGTKAWQVSGHASGLFGGELTAIAYCVNSKRPLLREVTAQTAVGAGSPAAVTTPACPKGHRLTVGGFSANGSNQALFAGGSINPNESWTAFAYGYFGAAPALTAYGYCLKPGV